MKKNNKKVCMFVLNSCTNDARVLKEAATLGKDGYDVSIIATASNDLPEVEKKDFFTIYRVKTRSVFSVAKKIERSVFFAIKNIAIIIFSAVKNIVIIVFSAVKNIVYIVTPTAKKISLSSFPRSKRKTSTFKHNDRYNLNFPGKEIFKTVITVLSLPFLLFLKWFYRKVYDFLMKFHKITSFISFWIQSKKLAEKIDADIYHAHDLNTLPGAYWASKKGKAKLVYDSHELYVERNTLKKSSYLGKYLLGCAEAFFARRCDAVITVNESIAKELAKRYSIDKPSVIMNTPSQKHKLTNTNTTSLRDHLGISNEYSIMLYCGSMTFNRGLPKVIESLVHLPDCHLVFMGYGKESYKEYLLGVVRKNGLESRFSFFGPVPSDEVTIYAAGADLGVAPIANACLSYYYCSPNKMFEYLIAGLPIIASDFPELKAVVEKFKVGYTFDPEDPVDIARVARRILDSPEQMKKMKENTAAASKFYNWENESKRLLDIYEEKHVN